MGKEIRFPPAHCYPKMGKGRLLDIPDIPQFGVTVNPTYPQIGERDLLSKHLKSGIRWQRIDTGYRRLQV